MSVTKIFHIQRVFRCLLGGIGPGHLQELEIGCELGVQSIVVGLSQILSKPCLLFFLLGPKVCSYLGNQRPSHGSRMIAFGFGKKPQTQTFITLTNPTKIQGSFWHNINDASTKNQKPQTQTLTNPTKIQRTKLVFPNRSHQYEIEQNEVHLAIICLMN